MWKTTPFAALLLLAAPVQAGKIERACNQSDRATTPALCSCIQDVANTNLSQTDQTLAARFFSDPQLAQDTRQSDDVGKEQFWERYKAFGKTAAKACG